MKILLDFFAGKRLFFITLGVVAYFSYLLLNYYVLEIEYSPLVIHIIRFFGELITFPLLFIQPVLLILSIIHCIKEKFRILSYSFWSFLILLIANTFCIGSFIIRL